MVTQRKLYPARIEALKALIREEKDPSKKKEMLGQLANLRELAKKEGAQIAMDSIKEGRARSAESAGDNGPC